MPRKRRSTGRKRLLSSLLAEMDQGEPLLYDELILRAWAAEHGSTTPPPPTEAFRFSVGRTLESRASEWGVYSRPVCTLPFGLLARIAGWRQPSLQIAERLYRDAALLVELWIEERTNPGLAARITGRQASGVGACLKLAFWEGEPRRQPELSQWRQGEVVRVPLTRKSLARFVGRTPPTPASLNRAATPPWKVITRPHLDDDPLELDIRARLTKLSTRSPLGRNKIWHLVPLPTTVSPE